MQHALNMQLYKEVSVSTIKTRCLSALKALCDYALYKSTFTFTYANDDIMMMMPKTFTPDI